MSSVTLCFIAHRRQHNLKRICEELYKIDDDLKRNLYVKVLNDQNMNGILIKHLATNFSQNGINFENVMVYNPTYYNKCVWMSKLSSDYVISCDEDIFMSTDGWNTFLRDIKQVNWEYAGLYAPVISSGIPSVEHFLDYFVDEDTCNYFRSEFSKVAIPNLWGVEYDHLKYDPNNPDDFFDQVNGIDHHYKGIHPIRVDANLQNLLVDYILQNDQWKNPVKMESGLYYEGYPYFCNSVWAAQTSFYKQVIEKIDSKEYIFDGFDEVALNQHLREMNKLIAFNLDVAAIHPSYNTIGMIYDEICNKFLTSV